MYGSVIRGGIRRLCRRHRPQPRRPRQGSNQLEQAGIQTAVGAADACETAGSISSVHPQASPMGDSQSRNDFDGRIATQCGDRVTGPKAQEDAHRLRARVDAVLVGVKPFDSMTPNSPFVMYQERRLFESLSIHAPIFPAPPVFWAQTLWFFTVQCTQRKCGRFDFHRCDSNHGPP